eukprot:3278421-Lingulodinium_polyedra.AAC.1
MVDLTGSPFASRVRLAASRPGCGGAGFSGMPVLVDEWRRALVVALVPLPSLDILSAGLGHPDEEIGL